MRSNMNELMQSYQLLILNMYLEGKKTVIEKIL